MHDLIKNLDDATAIRVLQAFLLARSRRGEYETEWSSDLRQSLAEQLEDSEVPEVVNDGELAREALQLLAGDPQNQEPLTALIKNPSAEKFIEPGTVAIGVAALVVLQLYVKFERTKDGKIHIKIEKQPLPVELMKKLVSFFSRSPG